ncbi:Plexin, cytoplasmic RasGAP domain containing protein [Parasponia andersonii]|uniref:Plexin, cytoplasmic RasGAP domain containing protein n=1 Tax=Parasponia andersonii TaxID=3476 RepID=A0A2P5CWM0_PARAD|nr:Plexin, cytoplasmic RasGAP domain containing protein [Parasponia andersonii]
MTEVLHSPSHYPRTSSSSSLAYEEREGDSSPVTDCDPDEEVNDKQPSRTDQLSLLALLVTLFRKSLIACKSDRRELCSMEIGWPTNVRHVAHVTFDRFNGFLGLPVEFEPEVPRRAPSASTTVFGVSTESMQLSYDSRGNSVPTILLLMQGHLYAQGGLRAEGIFRINAENSQEEIVRDQLNRGVIPEGVDVHSLAGLIKSSAGYSDHQHPHLPLASSQYNLWLPALQYDRLFLMEHDFTKAWFRELPTGVLDSLSPEQVIQCQTEDECAELVRLLPPIEAALLDWAINLMADVVQHEDLNKMNARNIAMVFAPNMTQMADPLTALMYAVQVMNFLKMLILRTLRERKDSVVDPWPSRRLEPYDENGHQSSSQTCIKDTALEDEETEQELIGEKLNEDNNSINEEVKRFTGSVEKLNPDGNGPCATLAPVDISSNGTEADRVNSETAGVQGNTGKSKTGHPSNSNFNKGSRKANGQQHVIQAAGPIEKSKGIGKLSRMNSRMELIEAWR